MSQKLYWSGTDELTNNNLAEASSDEFREELPFDLNDNIMAATTPRRDFLKFLGFSTLAATVVAGCEIPVRKAIPYAIKPEDITPGVPNYYASSFYDGVDYCAVVIKTRDGRPIKLEGNDMSSITKGGTSARVQAAVLSLYDKARIRHPYKKGDAGFAEATFDEIDRSVKEAIAAKPGYLVTASVISPTTADVIKQFLDKNKNIKHVVYDAVSYSGMLDANEACYGKRTLPTYHFEKAKTVVSFGADFLGTWLSPVEFAKNYAKGRKVTAKELKLTKHYQIESLQTITGASADERLTCRPSEMGAVVAALYGKVTGTGGASVSAKMDAMLAKAADDLKKGNGMVVCGSNDAHVQTIVNAINDKIGANGTTINWVTTNATKQGSDREVADMITAIGTGNVGSVFFHNVNPVYDYFDGKKLAESLTKVALTVSFNDRMDETTQKCKFVAPDHNFLESWGDAEPKPGYFSLMQPGIAPMFKTRAFQDTLLSWSGSTTSYHDMWKAHWMTKMGGQTNFDMTLQNGVVEPAGEMPMGGAGFKGNVTEAIEKAKGGAATGTTIELVVYNKVSIGHGGVWSNNPWLQEMPDPITKSTWDNYLCVSPTRAKELHDELTGFTEVEAKKVVVSVKAANGTIMELPILPVPGMHNDVVAIATGYGRDKMVGMAAASDDTKGGKNAYPFMSFDGKSLVNFTTVTIEKTNKKYELGLTQTHFNYENRPVVHEYTLEEFAKDPQVLLKERGVEIAEFAAVPWIEEGKDAKEPKLADAKTEEGYRENGTLYPHYPYEAIKWGMSIDLNSCTGCGACVVGCMAENNISVVGKDHVLKNHEMHWIRIDRYFSGTPADPDTIQTVFQPMMCQHCDNAPCENVCPVSATNHSTEGLNQMAYNRCIGTKYCANNCPFKVRHFNWMDWNGADCFDGNLYEDGRRDDMNDDLTRMVLNPDVTVRSRGVMEKCTFCVQRLQEGKLNAKKEGHPLKDGAIKTACQQACPSDAITFGNVNDTESAIYKLRKQEQAERAYYVLEHIHVLPNINYLARIRNTNEIVANNEAKNIFSKEHI